MYTLKREWEGSTDPEVFSGIATFYVNGKTRSIRLESYSDYVMIGSLLDAAYVQGHEVAVHAAMNKLHDMLEFV
jgi:hypothetical protein